MTALNVRVLAKPRTNLLLVNLWWLPNQLKKASYLRFECDGKKTGLGISPMQWDEVMGRVAPAILQQMN